jgi:hypothetical protein
MTVLSLPLFMGFALAVVVALLWLRRTPLFWLPGAALVGYGIAIYVAWPWYDTHHDVGGLSGLEGLSNVMHVAATAAVVAGGAACLFIGARSWRRFRRG